MVVSLHLYLSNECKFSSPLLSRSFGMQSCPCAIVVIYYFYCCVSARILPVCGIVLVVTVAMLQCYSNVLFYHVWQDLAVFVIVLMSAIALFQCYTDYLIFNAACMPRSWQYVVRSCRWQLLCFSAILIIFFLSQCTCLDPGSGPVL